MSPFKPLKDVDVTGVSTDFEPGDYVYFKSASGMIFFGHIVQSSPAEIIFKTVHGNIHMFNKYSDMSLAEALKRMGKPLDVNNVYEGDIISTIVQTVSGSFKREYAEISQTIGDTALGIKFLLRKEPSGAFEYDGSREEYIYATDANSTLEEKMIRWELEG